MGHISRHSGTFFVGTVFSLVAGYLFKVYLARVLGAEALGIYALGMTLVGFFGIFNGLGLPESAVRFVAAYSASSEFEKLRAFLWRSIGLLLGSNLLFVTAFLIAGPWIALRFYHSTALLRYLYLFAVLLLFGAIRTFLERAMAGYKDVSRRTLIVNFVGTPTTIAAAVLLISLGTALRGYIVAQILSSLVVVWLLAAAIWRLTPVAARGSRMPLQPMDPQVWSFSATVFGMSLLGFVMSQTDKITLGYILGARQVGIYAVAAALVAYVPLALQSVNQIFAPTIADLHTRGEHAVLARLFQTLTKWIIALTVPLAIVMIVFARPLMRIFGHDFEVGWPILIIGTIGQLVNCAVGSVGYMLLMSGHQRRVMRVQFVAAGLVVLLNIVLIPVWGIVGAAVASAATNVASNIWYLAEVRGLLQLSPYNRSYLKVIVPTIAAVACLWIQHSIVPASSHLVRVVLAALTVSYTVFLSSFVSFGLTDDDRMILGTVWRRIEAVFAR
jgi:O-antigen/teichoic acid export membrane protein